MVDPNEEPQGFYWEAGVTRRDLSSYSWGVTRGCKIGGSGFPVKMQTQQRGLNHPGILAETS